VCTYFNVPSSPVINRFYFRVIWISTDNYFYKVQEEVQHCTSYVIKSIWPLWRNRKSRALSPVLEMSRYMLVYHTELLFVLNFIPVLTNICYIHLYFPICLTVYPCFAFKEYIGTSTFPFRALSTKFYKEPCTDVTHISSNLPHAFRCCSSCGRCDAGSSSAYRGLCDGNLDVLTKRPHSNNNLHNTRNNWASVMSKLYR
jgi:hypothetical protein